MLKPHNILRIEEVKAERGRVPGISELVSGSQIHAGGQVTYSEGPLGSPCPHPGREASSFSVALLPWEVPDPGDQFAQRAPGAGLISSWGGGQGGGGGKSGPMGRLGESAGL